jgi:rare lipoprotein A (peptidoglycan hydrolase)
MSEGNFHRPEHWLVDLHYQVCCEAIMGVPSKIAIGIVSAWIGLHVNPAAAQNFNERWSIIPKANAAEPEGQVKPVPQTQPSTGAEAASPPASTAGSARAEDRSGSRSPKRGFSGKASYYSYRSGKTASGLLFNRNSLTAAHRSLPFGTRVRVTDIATKKSVTVTITDRGPRTPGRVLDLSLTAARSLGITDRGVAHVHAEVL